MEVRVKKLNPNALVPQYQTDGSACFDLHVLHGTSIPPGAAATLATGLAFEIPDGCVMLVFSRSGHAFKHNVRLGNCVGVIDSDYRGEVMVRIINDHTENYFNIDAGERVAQAMIISAPRATLKFAEELTETDRGTGGFGSTGS